MQDFLLIFGAVALMAPLIWWVYETEPKTGQTSKQKELIRRDCEIVEEWTGSRFVAVENPKASTIKSRTNPVTGDYEILEVF